MSKKRKHPIWDHLDSSTAWLIYYFSFNLGLTIYNKRVLLGFPFPWTLTGVHTLASTFGSQVALNRGLFKAARLSRRDSLILVAFSILYTVNIAVSNLSLHLVTVPVSDASWLIFSSSSSSVRSHHLTHLYLSLESTVSPSRSGHYPSLHHLALDPLLS